MIFPVLLFALGILITSIFRTAAVRYEFSGDIEENSSTASEDGNFNIDYNLAFPGKVLPDHYLWPVKALRDKVWLWTTTDPGRKADLQLLFSDKRTSAAKILFEKGEYEIGYATLIKGEKYLEEASLSEEENRKNGMDTSEFVRRLAYASLKHRAVIHEILAIAPEDAKPEIIQTENYSIDAFERARQALNEKRMYVPIDPFERE